MMKSFRDWFNNKVTPPLPVGDIKPPIQELAAWLTERASKLYISTSALNNKVEAVWIYFGDASRLRAYVNISDYTSLEVNSAEMILTSAEKQLLWTTAIKIANDRANQDQLHLRNSLKSMIDKS